MNGFYCTGQGASWYYSFGKSSSEGSPRFQKKGNTFSDSFTRKTISKLKGLYCLKIASIVANCTLLLFLLQYCFEIYSADNSSSLIKACKTDSEGKVVEGLF